MTTHHNEELRPIDLVRCSYTHSHSHTVVHQNINKVRDRTSVGHCLCVDLANHTFSLHIRASCKRAISRPRTILQWRNSRHRKQLQIAIEMKSGHQSIVCKQEIVKRKGVNDPVNFVYCFDRFLFIDANWFEKFKQFRSVLTAREREREPHTRPIPMQWFNSPNSSPPSPFNCKTLGECVSLLRSVVLVHFLNI